MDKLEPVHFVAISVGWAVFGVILTKLVEGILNRARAKRAVTLVVSTPKTLLGAIWNGLVDSNYEAYPDVLNRDEAKIVEKHVRDFLAQRFAAAMLSTDPVIATAVGKLWKEIIVTKGDL